MSSENEDQVLLKSPDGNTPKSQKKSKISYTRGFLLSLSELDVCQKLPNGFDASVLSEFEDASNSTFERQRNLGGLPLQGPKRGEYGLLSQNRSDSVSGYSRGGHGRWDTRSSGSSDKEGDLQPERESAVQDSGRRFSNQTRRHLQNSEHDGLLGSGAFPRPLGQTGTSVPNARGSGNYQLSRTTEPYQPPRPFKAMPYSRKDSTDSYNDETFGSIESSTEDRAEEERKRRVSFELMRKEQQKVLQEKNKENLNNRKGTLDVDIVALLGNSVDDNSNGGQSKPGESVAIPSHSDVKSSLHGQAFASRPLVPPGFASALVEKNLPLQSSSASSSAEAGDSLLENKHALSCMESNQSRENIAAACLHATIEKNAHKITSHLSVDRNEKLMAPVSSAESVKQAIDYENMSSKITLPEMNEVWADDVIIMDDLSCKKGPSEAVNSVVQDPSTTLLEKLFSSALSKNFSSTPKRVEHQDARADEEKRSSAVFESSKFACWFSEEEKKHDDVSSVELLSLIASNEKTASQVSTSAEKVTEHIPLNLTLENIVTPPKLPMLPATSSVLGVPEQYSQAEKKGPSSVVLTCEDLEQSILAEVKNKSPSLTYPVQGTCTASVANPEKQKAHIDDLASQHLLSLLQKGSSFKESTPSPGQGFTESSERFLVPHLTPSSNLNISDAADVENHEMVHSPEQTLTLETLFGASFMNALHSAEAPVSAQRGSADNTDDMQPQGLPFPCNDGFLSSTSHEPRYKKAINEVESLTLNKMQKDHKIQGSWFGEYGDSSIEVSRLGNVGAEEGGAVDIQLPEEDSLISVGDTLNRPPFPFDIAHRPADYLPEKNVENINDRILNAILRDRERPRTHMPDGLTRLQKGPLEMVDPNNLYHHVQNRPPSQLPHQMDQPRPLFPPLDHLGHRNPQMKFAGPDVMHLDPHHPFHGNLIPHHGFGNVSAPRFDPLAAHHQILQHMPVPGNFPHHHSMQGLPRGVPLPHPINHIPGYIPEMNNMHSLPLHNRQPNYGVTHGMGLPGSVGGGNHPEALERLFEMEMRANSKQIHPPIGANIPGIYGPELDMNFRYR